MGIISEDAVLIKEAEKEGAHTVITVNCPDKTGLGCDLCRIILLFGLSIARGGIAINTFCFSIFMNFVAVFCFRQFWAKNCDMGFLKDCSFLCCLSVLVVPKIDVRKNLGEGGLIVAVLFLFLNFRISV